MQCRSSCRARHEEAVPPHPDAAPYDTTQWNAADILIRGNSIGSSFRDALKVWFQIGCLSFGGPAGQIATMHRILVDERKWIDEARFLHALNFCMLLPGPEAMQLATYIGWLLHRMAGGLIAGLFFILPGALVMLGLSLIYVLASGVPVVEGALFGIKAAVLVIVAQAVIRIGSRSLKTRPLIAIAACAFVGIFVLALPFPLIVIAAGLFGYGIARRDPALLGLKPADTQALLAPTARKSFAAAVSSSASSCGGRRSRSPR